ncbi:MAG: HEAT repeat domain-containing protein [Myxococcales bacterium]
MEASSGKTSATQASAAPPNAPKTPVIGPEEHARGLKEAQAKLQGSDLVAIQESLVTFGELGGRAAAEAVVARVRGGLPPQLAEQAIELLGALNQPVATPVLMELTQHRRWQIRQKAVAALGELRVRSTVSALLFALDDPSPEVRSQAAEALGNVGDPRALAALTTALERGVDGALTAIAKVGTSKQLDFLLTRAKGDVKATEPALWAWLQRSNVPAATKVKIIRGLDALNTEDALRALAGWQERLRAGEGDARLLAAFPKKAEAKAQATAQAVKP